MSARFVEINRAEQTDDLVARKISNGDTMQNIIDAIDQRISTNDSVRFESLLLTSDYSLIIMLIDIAKGQFEFPIANVSIHNYLHYMTHLHKNCRVNMNGSFKVVETRTTQTRSQHDNIQFISFETVTTPLSRALVPRPRQQINEERAVQCVQHLISLGADPRAPFSHTTEISEDNPPFSLDNFIDHARWYNRLVGCSMLYVALIKCKSVALAEVFIQNGATENSQTFFTEAMAMQSLHLEPLDLVNFFRRHYTNDEIKRMSMPDATMRTPLHYLALTPQTNVENMKSVMRYLLQDVGLIETPDIQNRTPSLFASRLSTATHITEENRNVARAMHEQYIKLQGMHTNNNLYTALRDRDLPHEMFRQIGQHVFGTARPEYLALPAANEERALQKVRDGRQLELERALT